jgi:putative hydrolase of the HAD superfamily
MSTQIEAVVFDFGGVLTLQPLERHMEALRALCGLDRSTFAEMYRRQRPDYDRGVIDSREYWRRVMDSRAQPADLEILRRLFEEDTAGWTRINEAVLRWAYGLQETGMRTAILSNMPRDILKLVQSRFPWFDRFEQRIFSCDIGVNKPDQRIYRACRDALGLAADRILFLDDIRENVQGAERAGFRTVLFRSLDDALHRIARNRWLPENLTGANLEVG